MDRLSFSKIKNFGFRNSLTISFTIAYLLLFSSYPSWANHPDFYSTPSPPEFSFSPSSPKVGFFKTLDDRFSSEIKNKFSDHSTGYHFNFSEPDFKHNNNKTREYEYNQDLRSTTQSALQAAFLKTINEIRWVLMLKDYMDRITSTQIRISKDLSFQGFSQNQTSLDGSLEEDSFFVGNLSLAKFPSLGIKLHTSNQLFETSLNYIPLNQFPFTVKMEHNFIYNSKIGFNFNWSNQENNLYTTLLFNF